LFPSEEEKKPQTEQQAVQSVGSTQSTKQEQPIESKIHPNVAPMNDGQTQQAGRGN
jgi:hypothetical protein